MMEFETQLRKLEEESNDLQKAELDLRTRAQLFNEKLMGFFKENGLPQDFTIPQMALLAIRKSRSENQAP